MKPCCFPDEQRCVDIAASTDYWECESYDGVLGPEGACCWTPADGSCTAPDHRCWRCAWEIDNPDDVRPCCFEPGLSLYHQFFDDIAWEQCRDCGGDPVLTREDCAPPTPSLLRPCCLGAECFNVSPGQEWQCDNEGGELGPIGTCCADPAHGPDCDFNTCWRCDWGPAEPSGECCFAHLNYDWYANIPWVQCWACEGQTGVYEEDCERPVPEPECIDAPRGDRPNPSIHDDEGTLLKWTLDTIGTAVFGESATEDVLRGYQYPVSVNLIRPKQADRPLDSCGHAEGRLTMLDDGYVYLETCSKPDGTSEDSFRRSYGLLRTFLPESNTPLAQANRALGMQDGYQYEVACIRLPWWTEAMYRSYAAKCGSDPI